MNLFAEIRAACGGRIAGAWWRRACCPRAWTLLPWRWSRRAMRRMATWRPMPRWCWPNPRACRRARLPRRWPPAAGGSAHCGGRGGGAGVPEPAAGAGALAGAGAGGAGAGRRLWPLDPGCRAEGQCGVRLGQPDRADACRPCARRGGGRCAGAASGLCRLGCDARILHQRRRRAGRCAGPVGL